MRMSDHVLIDFDCFFSGKLRKIILKEDFEYALELPFLKKDS